MKTQPTEWENIFTNDAADEGLISTIYKQIMWLNNKNINHSKKKWAEDLNRHFFKEDREMAKKSMKRLNITVQFSSVSQSCPTLCNPMNRSTRGLPVHH